MCFQSTYQLSLFTQISYYVVVVVVMAYFETEKLFFQCRQAPTPRVLAESRCALVSSTCGEQNLGIQETFLQNNLSQGTWIGSPRRKSQTELLVPRTKMVTIPSLPRIALVYLPSQESNWALFSQHPVILGEFRSSRFFSASAPMNASLRHLFCGSRNGRMRGRRLSRFRALP